MNKLLLVDDDKMIANIYRNKFSLEGFKVEIAGDGQEGLDLMQTFQPDVVILDLMLPKMSGVQLLTAIRAMPGCQKLPVIVFSNTYLSGTIQEAWKAGATKCLSKGSCSPAQLIKLVQNTLRPPAPAAEAELKTVPDQTPAPATPGDADTAFQTKLRESFIESLPATLNILRAQLRGFSKAGNESERLKLLEELCRKVHALIGNAGIAGMQQVAHFSDAVEALLKELSEKPKSINASTLRTVASAIDFLGVLFEPAHFSKNLNTDTASVLVVDDEELSRRAVVHALEKAKLTSVSVEDPLEALRLLGEKSYDLVLLDVDMPGINGFELCTKLRTMPAQKATPVVFVTRLTDFESRANSMISGGTDLIAKPFLFMELAVKALVYIMRSRLGANS
ncbi:MAG: response regulator [Verrucomicrobia bacterium]|nr:response regulator [Verrucomicrobiota bacterium]